MVLKPIISGTNLFLEMLENIVKMVPIDGYSTESLNNKKRRLMPNTIYHFQFKYLFKLLAPTKTLRSKGNYNTEDS